MPVSATTRTEGRNERQQASGALREDPRALAGARSRTGGGREGLKRLASTLPSLAASRGRQRTGEFHHLETRGEDAATRGGGAATRGEGSATRGGGNPSQGRAHPRRGRRAPSEVRAAPRGDEPFPVGYGLFPVRDEPVPERDEPVPAMPSLCPAMRRGGAACRPAALGRPLYLPIRDRLGGASRASSPQDAGLARDRAARAGASPPLPLRSGLARIAPPGVRPGSVDPR
jgi:hypothetical protein